MCKVIYVIGASYSSVGKGLAAASLGLLLKMRDLKVSMLKFDPYLNLSADLLSPIEHGDCSVLIDGTVADLDLLQYERITGLQMSSKNICTSGKIYKQILEEQKTNHNGSSIQVIPHITDKIQEMVEDVGKDMDLVVCEVGGTIMDAESTPHMHAIQRDKRKRNDGDVLVVLVSPLPYLNTIQEFKTKLVQRAVSDIRSFGIEPDILLCRSEKKFPDTIIDKVSNLTGVDKDAIFCCEDVKSIYQVPLNFYDMHLDDLIVDKMHLKRKGIKIHKYRDLVEKYTDETLPRIKISVVGKYIAVQDAYLSLKEALQHAAAFNSVKVDINWLDADKFVEKDLEDSMGIVVPGGFGNRAIENKIRAIKYARENNIPFLGICLGMQLAVVEFLRNVCDIKDANSQEFNEQSNVFHIIDGLQKYGEMRVGLFDCLLEKGTVIYDLYKKREIKERHRHRFEFNNDYREILKQKGMIVSGINHENNLVESIELKENKFHLGIQFHPEYQSRINEPHPLFVGLMKAAIKI